MSFKVGDEVRWSSQAAGFAKEKRGVVVKVVPANTWLKEVIKPLDARSRYTVRTDFAGLPRDHESYLVEVPGPTEKAKKRLYWPRASGLAKAD